VRLAKMGHHVSIGDISPSQLQLASENADQENVKLAESYLCNIEKGIDAFGKARFDAIFFMDVVEHLKNPVQGLENLRYLLKEGGQLILHTPNACTVHRFLWHMIRRGPNMDYFNPEKLFDFHFQTYDY